MSGLESIRDIFKGNDYHWEPTKPHASVWVRVKEVTWNGDEFWLETVTIDHSGNEADNTRNKNELSRFIEAISFNRFT